MMISNILWFQFDSLVDLYEKYNTESSVEIMFLGTHRNFRRRGIAVGEYTFSNEYFCKISSKGKWNFLKPFIFLIEQFKN